VKNLKTLLAQSKNLSDFTGAYFGYLSELMSRLDRNSIEAFAAELENARQAQNTVFFIGNGGSSATASHMANDFGVETADLSSERLPLRALSLADNMPAVMAIANDHGFEHVFVDQLRSHYRAGDKLVAISASGNSPNVMRAAEWVKTRGGKVIGFLGFDGGRLKSMCDITIHVETPKGEYGPVEDLHMILDHLIYTWIRGLK